MDAAGLGLVAAEGSAEATRGVELLTVRGVSKQFGGTQALDDVGMRLESGEILALLGENGAGDRILARITRRSWERLGLAEGASVHAQIKSVALSRDGVEGG